MPVLVPGIGYEEAVRSVVHRIATPNGYLAGGPVEEVAGILHFLFWYQV